MSFLKLWALVTLIMVVGGGMILGLVYLMYRSPIFMLVGAAGALLMLTGFVAFMIGG